MKLLDPRETRTGKVRVEWDPISTLHRELDARYAKLMEIRGQDPEFFAMNREYDKYKSECHGIAVAVSALRCETIEDVAKQAHERYLGFQNRTA